MATTRPPIVVVMGHIDHGKTTILDWYRKTKVAEKESGGITQHIGAYEMEHRKNRIAFIDTPGHEAFSAMRSRGANVADIAILVVAADEGVKPQTKEAIGIIRNAGLPFIVALNKVDKPEANPEKVLQELAEESVLVEEYGGKVPAVKISAKSGEGMDALLEMVLLVAELEDLHADIQKPAEGVVIEAHVDARRGITATFLVRDGTLKHHDIFVVGRATETVKILENFLGKSIDAAPPSSPVRIAGLSSLPDVGEMFRVFSTKAEAEAFAASLPEKAAERKPAPPRETKEDEEEKPVFNLILKTDVAGSKEALDEMLAKFVSDAIRINILRSEVGDINESDVKLAAATKLVTIVGFRVTIGPNIRELAENLNIRILTGEVIYELVDRVKGVIEKMLPATVRRIDLGKTKILKVFKRDGKRQIVGGRVEEGMINKDGLIEIKRGKETVGRGNILELQHQKQAVEEVRRGMEFGIKIESEIPIQEGDVFEIFREETTKQTLS